MLAALAVLTVAGGCHDPDDFLPTAPETVDSLVLSVSASSMPADGFSRIEIFAQIDPLADDGKRTVVFTTTAGIFVGETEDNSNNRTKKVAADTTGLANGNYLLQATAVDFNANRKKKLIIVGVNN